MKLTVWRRGGEQVIVRYVSQKWELKRSGFHCISKGNLQKTLSLKTLCGGLDKKTVLRKHARWLVKNRVCITRWRHRTNVRCWRSDDVIKVNKLFSFFSSRCFLKEIENMYSVFLPSYTNTRESLGELETAVETLACGSCSHSISRSPKLSLVFV